MQITMSMKEYEEFKRNYDNEVYRLEEENARLRKENKELAKEIFRLKTQIEKEFICESVKPASKGGFFF